MKCHLFSTRNQSLAGSGLRAEGLGNYRVIRVITVIRVMRVMRLLRIVWVIRVYGVGSGFRQSWPTSPEGPSTFRL